MTREEAIKIIDCYDIGFYDLSGEKIPAGKLAVAFDMAIEALKGGDAQMNPIPNGTGVMQETPSEDGSEVVRCKDCKHANECHKSVQYAHNEPNTVTIGYTKIDFCSHGERRKE